jgi:hypothetical protein
VKADADRRQASEPRGYSTGETIMRTKQNPVRLVLCAAALLVACSYGTRANAQSAPSAVQARFTLPYQVQWGKAVLPAGDYLITFDSSFLTIRDAKNFHTVANEPTAIRQDGEGESALLISVRGHQRVVRSLTISQLGQTFVYPASRAAERESEEARRTQSVPVLVASK